MPVCRKEQRRLWRNRFPCLASAGLAVNQHALPSNIQRLRSIFQTATEAYQMGNCLSRRTKSTTSIDPAKAILDSVQCVVRNIAISQADVSSKRSTIWSRLDNHYMLVKASKYQYSKPLSMSISPPPASFT
ncbi:hypothetical protein BKA56DRAFT_610477 [Ilyonectria sp. MPI-CAGE-AT-0026]|nr:hypothetical protein BKA56DRAFT_610477 [Ilyonectria sp. MPI-CAGE-AT-0026]